MPLKFIREDLCKVSADALVNSANPTLIFNHGVDEKIYEAAGKKELMALRKKAGLKKPGDVFVTPALNLPARYLIHVIAPVYEDGLQNEKEVLKQCYQKALQQAIRLECKSIAFPLLGAGNNGFFGRGCLADCFVFHQCVFIRAGTRCFFSVV